MQVNLFYHPAAFATLDDAFDPLTNARYAGLFLAALWPGGHLGGGGGGVSFTDAGAERSLHAERHGGLAGMRPRRRAALAWPLAGWR